MAKVKYTREILESAVRASATWRQVCEYLGRKPFSGNEAHFKRRAEVFKIDFSHFTGQAWRKGRTFIKKPIETYLVEGLKVNSNDLRKKLIREGIKENKCEKCGLSEWLGQPLRLELDHKNSDHFDNRLENLQILCPNCHSLKTYTQIREVVLDRRVEDMYPVGLMDEEF